MIEAIPLSIRGVDPKRRPEQAVGFVVRQFAAQSKLCLPESI